MSNQRSRLFAEHTGKTDQVPEPTTPNDDMPVMQYEIVFPEHRLLPGRIDSDAVSTESTNIADQVSIRIPERLPDHIECERKVVAKRIRSIASLP